MKPLSEPSQGRENAYLGWTDNQLLRRPPVLSATGETKWCTAQGSVCEDAVQTTDFRFVDLSEGATNDPAIFQLTTGPNGVLGVEILVAGVYRMWQNATFSNQYDDFPNATDYTAVQYFDFISYFGNDTSFTNGINTRSLQSDEDVATFYMRQELDLFIYDASPLLVVSNGPPYNVIEMAIAQDTLLGGCWWVDIELQVLPFGTAILDGDFTGVTYLPV